MTLTERDLHEVLATDVAHLPVGGDRVRQVHGRIRQARRRRQLAASGVLAAAVAAAAVVLTVPGHGGSVSVTPAAPTINADGPVSPALGAALAGIPSSAYAAVGVSRATPTTSRGSRVAGLKDVSGIPVVVDGKPTFVFISGEFCPYCASESWAIAAALVRFGTFSGLRTTQSSGSDVYPDTSSLSFRSTAYTSKYLNADLYEIEDRAGKPLQTPSLAAATSFNKYDPNGGIPFLSINNRYIGTVQYSPDVLHGMSAGQIGAALNDPSTDVAQQTLTAANILTAGICATTDQQPAAVCKAPEVQAAAAYLNTGGP